MTTVKTFCGAESVERNTSRVLAPPGGKSNINLFGAASNETTSTPVNTCQAKRQQSHVFEAASSDVKVNSCQAKRQESHIFDKPANQAATSTTHTSSRVLKAPGGGSSITFG